MSHNIVGVCVFIIMGINPFRKGKNICKSGSTKILYKRLSCDTYYYKIFPFGISNLKILLEYKFIALCNLRNKKSLTCFKSNVLCHSFAAS